MLSIKRHRSGTTEITLKTINNLRYVMHILSSCLGSQESKQNQWSNKNDITSAMQLAENHLKLFWSNSQGIVDLSWQWPLHPGFQKWRHLNFLSFQPAKLPVWRYIDYFRNEMQKNIKDVPRHRMHLHSRFSFHSRDKAIKTLKTLKARSSRPNKVMSEA